MVEYITYLQGTKFTEGKWAGLSNGFGVLIKMGSLIGNSLICNGGPGPSPSFVWPPQYLKN